MLAVVRLAPLGAAFGIVCSLYILAHFSGCVFESCEDDVAYGLSRYTRHRTYVSSPVSLFGILYVVLARVHQSIAESHMRACRTRILSVILCAIGWVSAASLTVYLCVPYIDDDTLYAALHTGPVVVGYSLMTVWLWAAIVSLPRSASRVVAIAALAVVTVMEIASGFMSLVGAPRTGSRHALAIIELSLIAASVPLTLFAAHKHGMVRRSMGLCGGFGLRRGL